MYQSCASYQLIWQRNFVFNLLLGLVLFSFTCVLCVEEAKAIMKYGRRFRMLLNEYKLKTLLHASLE